MHHKHAEGVVWLDTLYLKNIGRNKKTVVPWGYVLYYEKLQL